MKRMTYPLEPVEFILGIVFIMAARQKLSFPYEFLSDVYSFELAGPSSSKPYTFERKAYGMSSFGIALRMNAKPSTIRQRSRPMLANRVRVGVCVLACKALSVSVVIVIGCRSKPAILPAR